MVLFKVLIPSQCLLEHLWQLVQRCLNSDCPRRFRFSEFCHTPKLLFIPLFATPGSWLSRGNWRKTRFSFCSAYTEAEPTSMSGFSVFFVLLALPCHFQTLFLAWSKTWLLDTYDVRICPFRVALNSSFPYTSPHHKSCHQSWWCNHHIDGLYIY